MFVLGDPRGDAAVKLLDFGIAKVISDAQRQAGALTTTSSALTSFTAAYGAPEQFSRSHGATGPWTDVFAFALILVETVSGRSPLDGHDFVQLAVASQDPTNRPTPRAFGVPVSDETEAVFAKALAVKPANRWQTAGELWSALRQSLRLEGPEPPSRVSPGNIRTTDPGPSEPATAPTSARHHDVGSPSPPSLAALLAAGRGRLRRRQPVQGRSPPRHGPGGRGSLASLGQRHSERQRRSESRRRMPAGNDCHFGWELLHGERRWTCPMEEALAPCRAGTPFCIDKYEVTTADYKACSDSGRCKRAGTTNDYADLTDKERKALDPLCNARDPEERASHPINCVDWEMAGNYCGEHQKRLPTEAEWEFAARGPDGRKYPWGDEDPTAGLLNACGKECAAWGKKNGIEQKAMYDSDDGFPNTAPVGSFPKGASRFGVEDVVGNVWEWVADWYGPYGADDEKEPKGPEKGEARVIRGGAWNGSYPSWVRPTFRYRNAPAARTHGIGFRCAADR